MSTVFQEENFCYKGVNFSIQLSRSQNGLEVKSYRNNEEYPIELKKTIAEIIYKEKYGKSNSDISYVVIDPLQELIDGRKNLLKMCRDLELENKEKREREGARTP